MSRHVGITGITVVLIAALAVTDTSPAGAPETGRCRELKAAATAQRVSDLLDAYSRNRATPDPARLKAEIAKGDATFDSEFQAAEAQGPCARKGNAQKLRKKSDEFVRTITIEALQLDVSPAADAGHGTAVQPAP
jgi:hypothetical protein